MGIAYDDYKQSKKKTNAASYNGTSAAENYRHEKGLPSIQNRAETNINNFRPKAAADINNINRAIANADRQKKVGDYITGFNNYAKNLASAYGTPANKYDDQKMMQAAVNRLKDSMGVARDIKGSKLFSKVDEGKEKRKNTFTYQNDPDAARYIQESFDRGNQLGKNSTFLPMQDWAKQYKQKNLAERATDFGRQIEDLITGYKDPIREQARNADSEFLRNMTPEQQQEYSYLLGKDSLNGTNNAEQYLDLLYDDITSKVVNKRLEDYKNASSLGKAMYDVIGSPAAGLENGYVGATNLFENYLNKENKVVKPTINAQTYQALNDLAGETGKPINAIRSEDEIINMEMAGATPAEMASDKEIRFAGLTPRQIARQALFMSGNMAGSQLAGLAATAAGLPPQAAAAVGALAMFPQVAGNAYNDTLSQYGNVDQAHKYATLSGINEAVGEYLLGGLEGVSGKFIQNAITSLVPKGVAAVAGKQIGENAYRALTKVLTSPVTQFAMNAATEGLEEIIQGTIDTALRNAVLNENNKIDPFSEENLQSAMIAAISVIGSNGPAMAVNYTMRGNYGNQYMDAMRNMNMDYQQIADSIPDTPEAYTSTYGLVDTQKLEQAKETKALAQSLADMQARNEDISGNKNADLAEAYEQTMSNRIDHLRTKAITQGNKYVESEMVDKIKEGFDEAGKKAFDELGENRIIEKARPFAAYYNLGRLGIEVSDRMVALAHQAGLTEEERQAAMRAGAEDMNKMFPAHEAAKFKAMTNSFRINKKPGTVTYADSVDQSKLTEQQKFRCNFAKAFIADTLGMDVVFTQSAAINGSYDLEHPNGSYQTVKGRPTITLDVNAGMYKMSDWTGEMSDFKRFLPTISHELTHYLENANAEAYHEIASRVVNSLQKSGYYSGGLSFNEILNKEREKLDETEPGRVHTLEDAMHELVARSCEDMLSGNKAAMQAFESLDADTKKTLADHIKEVFDNIKAFFENLLSGYRSNTEEAEAIRENIKEFEEIRRMWNEALGVATGTEETAAMNEGFEMSEAVNEADIRTDVTDEIIDKTTGATDTDGHKLFQYKAMEHDLPEYRSMLRESGMNKDQIDQVFDMVDKVMVKVKANLQELDYDWEKDIDDRSFQAVKPNSDPLYKVSVDFSTLCRKRILQQIVQTHLQEALDRALTKEESIAIRERLEEIRDEGRQIEIACALCYVESARMKSPVQIQKFLDNRREVIKDFFANKDAGTTKEKKAEAELRARERLHKEYLDQINKKAYADPMAYTLTAKGNKKYTALKDLPAFMKKDIIAAKHDAVREYVPTEKEAHLLDVADSMSVSDFTSPEGLANLVKEYPRLFDAYTTYVRNATKSKGLESDTWWRAGDSQKISDSIIEAMNKENGLRTQSWSDYQVIHTMDIIASIIELSARNAKMHGYTKVPGYVMLMGHTGQMLNMSLIPARDFTGSLEYDDVEGFPIDRAIELRDMFPDTAGTICIGIDDAQIRLLLDSDLIDYVIPYHESGMSKGVRTAMKIPTWKGYQNYQSEKDLDGKAAADNAKKYGVKLLADTDANWHKHTSFSEWYNEKDAKRIAKDFNSRPDSNLTAKQKAMKEKYGVMFGGYMAMQEMADRYKKLCAERGLAPKFSSSKASFVDADNYWKLLIDRKMVNNETGDIITQRAVKPVFDTQTILDLMDEELEKYGTIVADQDYALRTVVGEFLNGELDSKVAAISKLTGATMKSVNTLAAVAAMDTSEVQNSSRHNEVEDATDDGIVEYAHRVTPTEKLPGTDINLLDYLNEQIRRGEYITTFKAFLKVGNQYYSPMATFDVDEEKRAVMRTGVEIHEGEENDWLASDGKLTPERAATMPMKEDPTSPYGFYYGAYNLVKGDENGNVVKNGDVDAAYNPYQHSSNLVLNDQFVTYYKRPGIVVVECRIPLSEVNNPYWAPFAKDATGKHEWKSGSIAGQLENTDRYVYMTRYIQPVRELTNREVAEKIRDYVLAEDHWVNMFFNDLHPEVAKELENMGIEIDPYGDGSHIRNDAKNNPDRFGNKMPIELRDRVRAEREPGNKARKARKDTKDAKARQAAFNAAQAAERAKAAEFNRHDAAEFAEFLEKVEVERQRLAVEKAAAEEEKARKKAERERLKAEKKTKKSRNIETRAADPNDLTVIEQGSEKDVQFSSRITSKRLNKDLRVNMATFFSGAGTVDFALRNIVRHEFAVEYDAKIAAVYRKNNGNNIYVDDVRDVDIDPHKGKVEYFHASPVCKSYSNANNDQGEKPLDIETATATAKAIDSMQPKVVTIENVARYKNSEAIKIIEDALERNGYTFDKGVYRASDFGGATIRERMFLRAVKDGILPDVAESHKKAKTWYSVTKDLIPGLEESSLPNYMVERLDKTGLDLDNLDQPLFILGGEKSGKLTYAYADKPAPTILAKSTEARVVMPDGRVLRATPEFMGRIQGLPSTFDLMDGKGGKTNAYKVVGNGVPVQLTQAIVGPLLEQNIIQQKSETTGIQYSSRRDYAPTFYSKLQREVEGFKGDKIGAVSVESYLKGKGVKDEEIKWSGIRTFLEGKKSVNKSELMDYLKANELEIDQRVLTGEGVNTNDFGLYMEAKDALSQMASDKAYEMGIDIDDIDIDEDNHVWVAYGITPDGDRVELATMDTEGTYWSRFTLEGGENYREIIFKMPGSDYINSAMRQHWKGETGVLAHARVQDFQTVDGDSVLFVEEIQSDWHNAGMQNGYATKDASERNRLIEEENQIVKEQKAINDWHTAHREEMDDIERRIGDNAQVASWAVYAALTNNEEEYGVSNETADKIRSYASKDNLALYSESRKKSERQQELREKYAEIAGQLSSDTPDAPFRNNNYTDFVLKDLLRMAAEGDYDYLAWTTGEMQEERWSEAYAEGYRIEYDQDIPKFLKKYGKQWGAGLTTVTLDSFDEATVPAITVTDAMKDSVLYEGQPMYSMRNAGISNELEDMAYEYSNSAVGQLYRDNAGEGFEGLEDIINENDNPDLISAAETLGKIIGGIDQKPSPKAITELAALIRRKTQTATDLRTVKADIASLYDFLAASKKVNGADISRIAADIAGVWISNQKPKYDPAERAAYSQLRKLLRGYKFHMPAGFESEVEQLGGYAKIRKELFGTIMLTKDKGGTIDQTWQELSELDPGTFSPDISNPADQLETLIDIVKGMRPKTHEYQMEEDEYNLYRYELGQDILKGFVEGGKNAAMKQKYEELLDKGLKKAKDKAKAQREKARLRKFDREARTELLEKARKLAKMKGGPEFEAKKEELIGNLDLVAKGIRSDTKAKLEALMEQADALAATDKDYKALGYESDREKFSRLSKVHINDMTGQDVEDLTNAIVELIYTERNHKKMLAQEQAILIATEARRAMEQQSYAKGINGRNIIGSTFGRYALNMLNPVRALQRLDGYQQGGVFTDLGKELNDGQTKKYTFIMNATKKFNDFLANHKDLVKTWYKQDIDTGYKDKDGKPVYISKGMRISLYLHGLNGQNLRHVEGGGIEIPDAELLRKGRIDDAWRYSTTVKLRMGDIERLTKDMTEDELAFAALAHDFLNRDTKDAINEASLTLNGIMKAVVDDYFPIKVDKDFTRADITGLVQDGTIEGMGMLKERKNDSKPILLEDVAQVLQRQIENTALYYGLAVPVRDFNKLMQYTEVGGEGSVTKAVRTTWGSAGINYINDMLKHIQGGADADADTAFRKLKSAYAGTVLNFNLSVAIKQTASAPFAATVLDAKSIAKAFAKNAISKADYDYMDSITPWSYMRRQGMSGTEMGEVYRQKTAVDANTAVQELKRKLNWIQAVDVWTTDRLFFATEYYVQDHFPSLEVRSPEYNAKVAELYNDVLQRTQPSYNVMQRNAYLRSGTTFSKVLGMFKTQTFNMGGEVIDAWSKMVAADRMYKDNRASEAKVKEAKAQFGKTIAATVASQLMLTMLAIAARALLHTMKNYRDDKGEITAESLAARGLYEFLTSFAGMTLGGSEAQSALLAMSGKEKFYDMELPGLNMVNDLITSSVDMCNAYQKAVENGWDKESAEKFRKKTIQFGMNAAIAKRIPANNIYNLGNALYLWYQDWKNGTLGTFDAGKSLFGLKDSTVTKEQYAKQAMVAYQSGDVAKGDKAAAKTTQEQIQKAIGAVSNKDDNGKTITNSKKYNTIDEILTYEGSDEAKGKLFAAAYPSDQLDAWAKKGRSEYDFMMGVKLADEIADKDIESDERYSYVVNAKGYTNQQKVAWLLADKSKTESKAYLAWKDAGGTDWDYIKCRSDLEKFKGDGKQKKIVAYIQKQTPNEKKQRALWTMAGYKESTFDKQMGAPTRMSVNVGDVEMPNWDTEEYWNGGAPGWRPRSHARYFPSPGVREVKKEEPLNLKTPVGGWSGESLATYIAATRAENPAKRDKLVMDYIKRNVPEGGMQMSNIFQMQDAHFPSKVVKAAFDKLPMRERYSYIMENWPMEVTAKYRDQYEASFETGSMVIPPAKELEKFIDSLWQYMEVTY